MLDAAQESRGRWVKGLGGGLLLLSLCVLPSTARAQSAAQICIDHHAQAQENRSERRWQAARGHLLACAASSCPGVIAGDCTRWLDELDQQMPSVVLVVRRGGRDVGDASLTLDGNAVQAGAELEVDPGEHVIIVRTAAEPAVEQRVRVSPGEKSRLVHVELPSPDAPNAPTTTEAAVPMHRPVPWYTWALGGGALALAGAGTTFGILAMNERSQLALPPEEGGCAPVCTAEQTSNLSTLATVSDIAFGTAIAAGIGAGITYLLRPEVPLESAPEKETAQVRWSVGPTGAFIGYGGKF
ncbi:MAG TPA: hypothetical protein VLC09_15915 [Polyangiaceae bacterium]|nr:hypothetical protein [Polyangiaceae bacterium]